MTEVATHHIHLDSGGVAWIDDTNTKVVEVVLDSIGQGWSPEEIHEEHPHLTLAQIHAALAYYHDHRAALDAEIEQREARAEALRKAARPQVTRAELERRRGAIASNTLFNNLGDWMRQARLERGLSRTELASQLAEEMERDLNAGRLAEWETGLSRPSSEQQVIIRRVLERATTPSG
jgi:uncharacterized protein (DUF433 family)